MSRRRAAAPPSPSSGSQSVRPSDGWYFALRDVGLPYVVALKTHRGTWARTDLPHTPIDAARALADTDPDHRDDWRPIEHHFRDGHTETWWAADARLGGYGPDSPCRLVVATTDPRLLPEKTTWYLATNPLHPDAPHSATSPHPPADLAEVVRLYGLRPDRGVGALPWPRHCKWSRRRLQPTPT
ncbi:hypothetical protein [Streptomyces sp. NL15-2K]|uniref:hypothetical protein n=1 Tax=Streptomyces sp. NL15-2K TaxID=376149 RepID=UPI000FF994DA|nr:MULTISPECIES: hypothetical protein [Actinomycetes]WKX06168.1 hypothetical protein Q4V64_01170 [Kutzneria buriramensis]GCB52979.1 hypothetical protein SNL152K_10336 [Streptomyces sp. NL15-2K]